MPLLFLCFLSSSSCFFVNRARLNHSGQFFVLGECSSSIGFVFQHLSRGSRLDVQSGKCQTAAAGDSWASHPDGQPDGPSFPRRGTWPGHRGDGPGQHVEIQPNLSVVTRGMQRNIANESTHYYVAEFWWCVCCSRQKRRSLCGTLWMNLVLGFNTPRSRRAVWLLYSTLRSKSLTLCCGLCKTWKMEVLLYFNRR